MDIAINFVPIVAWIIVGFVIITLVGHVLGRSIQ